jgi:hypothetical protein
MLATVACWVNSRKFLYYCVGSTPSELTLKMFPSLALSASAAEVLLASSWLVDFSCGSSRVRSR